MPGSLTALQVAALAYQQAVLDQTLTSFATTQEFPYDIALTLINTVIREMNREGRYDFSQGTQALTYSGGVSSYNLETVASAPIKPRDIIEVRREASGYQGALVAMNYHQFLRRYRSSTVSSQAPNRWATYNNTLYLDTSPDQDYTLTIYYYKSMPLISVVGDTFLIPDEDIDVIQEGVYAYLAQRIGRPDFGTNYQLYMSKVKKLVADMSKNTGLARQAPAAF